MSGTTTQETKLKFQFTFKTDEGKKKNMSFNHAGSYSQELATRLTNIANAIVTYTQAFNETYSSVDAVNYSRITTTKFSEAQ